MTWRATFACPWYSRSKGLADIARHVVQRILSPECMSYTACDDVASNNSGTLGAGKAAQVEGEDGDREGQHRGSEDPRHRLDPQEERAAEHDEAVVAAGWRGVPPGDAGEDEHGQQEHGGQGLTVRSSRWPVHSFPDCLLTVNSVPVHTLGALLPSLATGSLTVCV